ATEQLRESGVDRRTDIYAAGIVLWETLVGERLFFDVSELTTFQKAMRGCTIAPGAKVPGIPAGRCAIVMRAAARHPNTRLSAALERALAGEALLAAEPVHREELAQWVRSIGGEPLRKQIELPREMLRALQSHGSSSGARPRMLP